MTEVRQHLNNFFKDNREDYIREIGHMIADSDHCKTRQEQISICLTLSNYTAGAESILRLKEQFKLQGDFTDMYKILEAVSITPVSGISQCCHACCSAYRNYYYDYFYHYFYIVVTPTVVVLRHILL